MFLSLLKISNSTYDTQRIADAYMMHQCVMGIYGTRPLYRLDAPERTLLVQSADAPSAELISRENWRLVRTAVFQVNMKPGKRYAFRLRANPVQTRSSDKKRFPLLTEEEQIAWLASRFQKAGIIDPCVHVEEAGMIPAIRGATAIPINSVTYVGQFTVGDPVPVNYLIANGIGKSRAFGCGLISAAPVPA